MFKNQEKLDYPQLFLCIYSKEGQTSRTLLFLCVSNQRGLFYHHYMVYFWDTLCWDVMNSITHYSKCCSAWSKSQKQVTERCKTDMNFSQYIWNKTYAKLK